MAAEHGKLWLHNLPLRLVFSWENVTIPVKIETRKGFIAYDLSMFVMSALISENCKCLGVSCNSVIIWEKNKIGKYISENDIERNI